MMGMDTKLTFGPLEFFCFIYLYINILLNSREMNRALLDRNSLLNVVKGLSLARRLNTQTTMLLH